MADSVYYVYAIVPPGTATAVAPEGIDGAGVELIVEDDLAALVSRVHAAAYAGDIDERVADVAWLGQRATAHDAVLTWASDLGAVIPLPLLSLFSSEDAVRDMLRTRHDELAHRLEQVARGREYGVRIFRIDDELRGVLGEHSVEIASLEADVANAPSPGQGYLLSRKLDAARKEQLRNVSATIANAAYSELAARSLDATQDAVPRGAGEQPGAAVLNAWFLVAHDRIDDFRTAVTEFMRRHDRRGFRVEFTGPWPPYHFTRSAANGR